MRRHQRVWRWPVVLEPDETQSQQRTPPIDRQNSPAARQKITAPLVRNCGCHALPGPGSMDAKTAEHEKAEYGRVLAAAVPRELAENTVGCFQTVMKQPLGVRFGKKVGPE